MTVSSATRNMYPLVTNMIHTLHKCDYNDTHVHGACVENGGYVDLQSDQIIAKPGIYTMYFSMALSQHNYNIFCSDMFNELLKYQP